MIEAHSEKARTVAWGTGHFIVEALVEPGFAG